MEPKEYWEECLSIAAEEAGFTLTADQLDALASGVEIGQDNYGMAFYSPPSSDRLHAIENEWKTKYQRLEKEFDKYRSNAETAVKKALRQDRDSNVSIGDYGEVFKHGGRTEQIQ